MSAPWINSHGGWGRKEIWHWERLVCHAVLTMSSVDPMGISEDEIALYSYPKIWEKRSGLYDPTIDKLWDTLSVLRKGQDLGRGSPLQTGKFPEIANNMHVCGTDRVLWGFIEESELTMMCVQSTGWVKCYWRGIWTKSWTLMRIIPSNKAKEFLSRQREKHV